MMETRTAQSSSPPARPRKLRRRLKGRLRPLRHWVMARSYRLSVWICLHMSHRAALRLGRLLGALGYILTPRMRRRTLRNLDAALGESMSPRERRVVARQSYRSVAMMFLEALHCARWSGDDFRRLIEFDGEEHERAALAPGKGSLYVTAHFGNWELMPPAYLYHSGIAIGVIMRDIRVPEINRRVREERGRGGIHVYSSDGPAISYIRALRRGGVVAMLVDQDTKHQRGMFLEFFGRPALTPAGSAFLARKTGASVLPVFIRRHRDDPTRHRIRFHAPIFPDVNLEEDDDIRRMLQGVTAALEEEVRSEPGQWAWMHERWKRAPAAGAGGYRRPRVKKRS